MENKKPLLRSSLGDNDLYPLLELRHSDPHRLLGIHELSKGRFSIRVWYPGARAVVVHSLDAEKKQSAGISLSCVHDDGLFENLLSQSTAAANSFVAPVLEASSINYTLSACAPSAPSSSSAAATLKTGSALLQKPYVVFQTGGGATLAWRNWPVDSYVQAIQWMQERYPHQIVLTGGHDNEAAGTAIAAACPRVLNLVQKTTLEETAALLRGAAMLVSTDTGVMHLGFAIGCPTLAFLHYRSPASMYGPLDYSPGHEIVELPQPSAETSVEARVSAEERPGNEMKQISFEKVTSAMERILEKKQN